MRKFTYSIFVLFSSLWFSLAHAQVINVENDGSFRLMDGYGNPITSTGNKLDVTVTGGGGDGAILDGVSSSIKATVFDYTNSNPLGVVLRDTNGDYVSVGGGTQYNQGTATTDTDTLSMVGCVRADTAAVATGVVDGDRARCIVDSIGRLWAHIGAVDGTVAVTQSGTWNLNNISGTISLPTGAATAALQDGIIKDGTGDTTQANVSSGRLHVDGSGVTQPVSGTVTVTDGAGALNVIVDSGTLAATQSGTWNITNISGTISLPTGAATAANQDGIVRDGTGDTTQANVSSGRLHVDGSGVTQPVSGTVTANAGSGTFTVSGTTFDGILRDGTGDTTQANVTSGRLQVDGSGVTQPVSGTVTVTDGAGALNVIVDSGTITVGAFPDNEPFNVAQINGVAPSMGNGISGTGVQRVTIASDSTGQVAVASLPNEGQQTMVNSISVAIASDQSSVGVTEQSSAAIVSGQQAVTASAVALPSNTAKEVCLKALVGNALNIYVGPSGVTTGTGIELAPGDGYCTRVTNTNALFVVASSTGSSISYAARN